MEWAKLSNVGRENHDLPLGHARSEQSAPPNVSPHLHWHAPHVNLDPPNASAANNSGEESLVSSAGAVRSTETEDVPKL